MERFSSWLQRVSGCGFLSEDLAPEYLQESGWGLVANKCTRISSILLNVPDHLLIRSLSVLKNAPYKEALSAQPSILTPFQLLCFFLCYERHLGPESEWAPYIDFLPTDCKLPATSAFEPDWLPQRCAALLENQRSELKQSYTNVGLVWRALCSEELDWQVFVWAWTMVNTRCVFLENNHPVPLLDNRDGDTVALVPYFDLLNHSSISKNIGLYNQYKKCYQLLAHDSVAQNDQVFVCYGAHSNWRLLLEYGFILPENPNNSLSVSLDDLLRNARKSGLVVTERHKEVLETASLCCKIYEAQLEPSWLIMAACKIISMSTHQLQWQRIYQQNDLSVDAEALNCGLKILQSLKDEYVQGQKELNVKEMGEFGPMVEQIWQEDVGLLNACIKQIENQTT